MGFEFDSPEELLLLNDMPMPKLSPIEPKQSDVSEILTITPTSFI